MGTVTVTGRNVAIAVAIALAIATAGCQLTTTMDYRHPQRGTSTLTGEIICVPRMEWADDGDDATPPAAGKPQAPAPNP